MEHSKLVPIIVLKKERLTILEIASSVIEFYSNLAKCNNYYRKVSIVSEKPSLYGSIDVNESEAKHLLAEEILNRNINDLIKQDEIKKPDIHFLMNKALISFSLDTMIGDDPFATLNFCFTTSKNLNTSIGSIVINKECFNSFKKAKEFLDLATQSFNVEYSALKISDRPLNRIARAFKAPLGYITYFSNDYELDIPNDLEGVEYEHTEKGKYLILTRDNLTFEDESEIKLYSDKLANLMETIADRVPEYKK